MRAKKIPEQKTTAQKATAQKTPVQRTTAAAKNTAPKPGSSATGGAKRARKGESGRRKDEAPSISAEERRRLVEKAAYFRAETRGFTPGYELQDWIEAEVEVLRLIGKA